MLGQIHIGTVLMREKSTTAPIMMPTNSPLGGLGSIDLERKQVRA